MSVGRHLRGSPADVVADSIVNTAEPPLIVLKPSAAKHGRHIARCADGGHEAMFGQNRIERNRGADDFGGSGSQDRSRAVLRLQGSWDDPMVVTAN